MGLDVVDDLPALWADPVMLDQVLTNLLENAAKYVDAGQQIRVSARGIDDGKAVRIVVEDAGDGVPDDALPRIFDKFYRAPPARSGGRRGTGLGLAVVRGLVEVMGGTVAARRSELGGLAVVVELMAARQPSLADVPT
jgi:signal transduction histidine kinase